ncbi:MAG TPA: iron ABC transporter permease [Emcibacteraceae bacterium]|nr:iron ABC transporter permease [Emcibacteraceae bacterium]HRW29075.1 iron ABC transporter permease [Emcibacteraceae bacterium]
MIAVVANILIGGYSLPLDKILAILLAKIGLTTSIDFAQHEAGILLSIRLPRLVLGIFVGAALGISGAVLQALFRNPLAEPGLIGVSSGAALFAVGYIVMGAGFAVSFMLPLIAFIGGICATLLIYALSRNAVGDKVGSMLLIGIAINAISLAGIGFFQFISDDTQLRLVTFWMMGGLGSATWKSILPTLLFIMIGLFALLRCAVPLNAYLLGVAEAGHLGIDTKKLTKIIILCVALIVGSAVAVSGIISFVGLIVPHVVRQFSGPDHRIVIPASALLGAIFTLIADLVARTVVIPAELPIGLVCSAVGGPFFLWLLLEKNRGAGYGL